MLIGATNSHGDCKQEEEKSPATEVSIECHQQQQRQGRIEYREGEEAERTRRYSCNRIESPTITCWRQNNSNKEAEQEEEAGTQWNHHSTSPSCPFSCQKTQIDRSEATSATATATAMATTTKFVTEFDVNKTTTPVCKEKLLIKATEMVCHRTDDGPSIEVVAIGSGSSSGSGSKSTGGQEKKWPVNKMNAQATETATRETQHPHLKKTLARRRRESTREAREELTIEIKDGHSGSDSLVTKVFKTTNANNERTINDQSLRSFDMGDNHELTRVGKMFILESCKGTSTATRTQVGRDRIRRTQINSNDENNFNSTSSSLPILVTQQASKSKCAFELGGDKDLHRTKNDHQHNLSRSLVRHNSRLKNQNMLTHCRVAENVYELPHSQSLVCRCCDQCPENMKQRQQQRATGEFKAPPPEPVGELSDARTTTPTMNSRLHHKVRTKKIRQGINSSRSCVDIGTVLTKFDYHRLLIHSKCSPVAFMKQLAIIYIIFTSITTLFFSQQRLTTSATTTNINNNNNNHNNYWPIVSSGGYNLGQRFQADETVNDDDTTGGATVGGASAAVAYDDNTARNENDSSSHHKYSNVLAQRRRFPLTPSDFSEYKRQMLGHLQQTVAASAASAAAMAATANAALARRGQNRNDQLMIGQHYKNFSSIVPYSIVQDADYGPLGSSQEDQLINELPANEFNDMMSQASSSSSSSDSRQQQQQQQLQNSLPMVNVIDQNHGGANNHNLNINRDNEQQQHHQQQQHSLEAGKITQIENTQLQHHHETHSLSHYGSNNNQHANDRALLPLNSNRLVLPQMQQIKSRFNQGCVGGTKCQFFAFCWMSGGSLGASCGLLMTCCVTPSRQEIQPGFYGPVVNDPYCGRSTSKINRIVGGTDASFGQFPWQAFVQVGGSRCGGALISSRHVVTAGHCVARSQHSPSSIKVTLGDYILNSDIESIPHEVFSVVEVLLHPNFRFTPQADRYDVAVLELDRTASYKDNIKPICLPQKDATFVGRVAYVAGWGALQAGSKLRPKVLQHVAVPVIENHVCESWHRRKGIDIRIYDEMMCAGYELGQRDACQGDSGGPLMLNQFGVWYLVGIVSAGYSCAKQYQPGIYHRVSSSSDWISSNVYQQGSSK